jgi:hypothetical protein
MTTGFEIPALARPAFFDGQRLTAADLTAVQAFHEAHRWLHNRALHGWGIVVGYAVAGTRGEREVRVDPGFALDARGREVLLASGRTEPVPAVADAARYHLTVSYAEDPAAETREGVCGTRGAVRLSETPEVRWIDADDPNGVRRGLDLVLATVEIENCQLAAPVSAAERRDALPASQPWVAAGRTAPGATEWRLWPAGTPLGVATTVPTSSGGFQSVPRYYASLAGDRVLGQGAAARVLDGHVEVADTGAEGFELRVILPAGVTGSDLATDTVTAAQMLTVVDRLASLYRTQGFSVALQRQVIVAANHLDLDRLAFRVGGTLRIPVELRKVVVTVEFLFGLPGIAARYGTTVDVLRAANGLTSDVILPGEELIVPRGTLTHVLGFEDDLWPVLQAIATTRGTDVPTLMAANGFTPAGLFLGVDDRLVVPPVATPLNPADVLTDTLPGRLRDELGWHVVWVGVEG